MNIPEEDINQVNLDRLQIGQYTSQIPTVFNPKSIVLFICFIATTCFFSLEAFLQLQIMAKSEMRIQIQNVTKSGNQTMVIKKQNAEKPRQNLIHIQDKKSNKQNQKVQLEQIKNPNQLQLNQVAQPQKQIQKLKMNQSLIFENIHRKIFNEKNKGKIFGNSEQFQIKINPLDYQNQTSFGMINSTDLLEHIQVGSEYDYANISEKVDFEKLAKDLASSISYQVIQFPYNKDREKSVNLIQIKSANSTNLDAYFQKILGPKNDSNLNLSSKLIRQPKNTEILSAEYLYYNKKYKIGEIKGENSICIFSSGYKTFAKNRYVEFFTSLERQNYTNFHIVYVDDNSPDEDVAGIISYLSSSNFSLNNNIKIVHTLQHLGALGNMYFWINKYCNQNDIVVNVDADDSLIGTQTLNVLNAVYQNPEMWFVYSKYIYNSNYNNLILAKGLSVPLRVNTSDYRKSSLWTVSHIRTFRKKLFQKIPLPMFLEYHLNKTSGVASPAFYNFAPDAFQIFSLLELAGNDRYKHLDEYLYSYSGSSSTVAGCLIQHERRDDRKSRIKTPLARLTSLEANASYAEVNSPVNSALFQNYLLYFESQKDCLNKP